MQNVWICILFVVALLESTQAVVSKPCQCTAPGDYCIEELSGNCSNGFAKVLNACFKSVYPNQFENITSSKDYDCCKSIGCIPIDDRCSGEGNFCIDTMADCPAGYNESLDCQKPVIENGIYVKSEHCKCCKPVVVSKPCQCTAPGDYCMEDLSGNCSNGFAKVLNACFKSVSPNQHSNMTLVDYDCCKSLGCIPIDDRCSGEGNFCIDSMADCPAGYNESLDCQKPVIENGINVKSEHCKCCKPVFSESTPDCGPECLSSKPLSCMCLVNGKECPDGYCSHDGDQCPHDSCTCCEDSPHTDVHSRYYQCSAPDDYCVAKSNANCPTGFSKILDACVKELNNSLTELCDCCKFIGCSSIGDQCSGDGNFCIEPDTDCPAGYIESFQCYKPLIENGINFFPYICKCCKPGI